MSSDSTLNLTLSIRFAWWLDPYLRLLTFFAVASRREPDWQKLGRMIERALIVRVAR